MKDFNLNGIVTFVCCLVIALGLNDVFFNGKVFDGSISVIAGTILMPGIMSWKWNEANKYQRILLAGLSVLYISFIGYLIYKYFNR